MAHCSQRDTLLCADLFYFDIHIKLFLFGVLYVVSGPHQTGQYYLFLVKTALFTGDRDVSLCTRHFSKFGFFNLTASWVLLFQSHDVCQIPNAIYSVPQGVSLVGLTLWPFSSSPSFLLLLLWPDPGSGWNLNLLLLWEKYKLKAELKLKKCPPPRSSINSMAHSFIILALAIWFYSCLELYRVQLLCLRWC